MKNRIPKFYTADTETTGGLTGKFLLGGLYDGKRYYEFDKEDDFYNFLINIKGTIFYHFLDFDIRFLIDWYQKHKGKLNTMPIMSADKKVIEWRIGNAIFRDSFILFQSSLRDLAKSFNLSIRKLEIKDYQTLTKNRHLRKYLKNDTIILYQVIKKFYKFIGWQYFNKRTIASLSLAKYKDIDKESYHKIIMSPIYHKRDLDFLRQGYFSSYYAIFNAIILGNKEKIIKIDCNSYYAHAMRKNLFPWGLAREVKEKDKIMDLYKNGNKLGIIQAQASIPQGLKMGFLPMKTENGVIYPTEGIVKGLWTTPEIKYAEKLGYKFQFEKAFFWNFKGYLFKKYIDYLAKIKESSVGAKRTIAKNLMVSLYGKFAQRGKVAIFKHTDQPITNKAYLDDDLTILEDEKYIRTPYSHPEISIFTTAYARIFLWKLCEEIGWQNIIAIMADSIIMKDNLSNEFKKKWIDPIKVGKFKIVSVIKKGIILARGVYALEDISGQEIIRNQGGVKEYNKMLKFKDFEKAIKSNKKVWKQYQNIKNPIPINAVLLGKGKIGDKIKKSRKIQIKYLTKIK